jgi:hypothetical protein
MTSPGLPRFDRRFFDGIEPFTVIGGGAIGGKARGLADIREALGSQLDAGAFPGLEVVIPTLTIIATDAFDQFLEINQLHQIALSDEPDDAIARAFQRGELPVDLAGDLRALVMKVHQPLAVRSSSLLEDALDHPFAGVYGTKMIPNNQPDPDPRFRRLVEAIKFVWASTFFRAAKDYIRVTSRLPEEEKMAVVIQEVVGRRHRDLFYPDFAGVARSYNFYPTGHARPKEGVVSLALGLGKTIVDGGRSWTYSPAYPRANPPYNNIRDLMQQTQLRFWAVNMGKPAEYDPLRETEYLVEADLETAEADEVLGMLASAYDPGSDRLVSSLAAPGPRILTFAPILVSERMPLNRAVTAILSCCEHAAGAEVEIEFAVTFPQDGSTRARLGFLQVRPMAVSNDQVDIPAETMTGPEVLAAGETALGNGTVSTIRDIVYLKPAAFDAAQTRVMAAEVEAMNRELVADGRPYLLVGFGRWGTSDPWLGVPVLWSQISGARAIIESSLPNIEADPSQGSHFFHNVTGFHVLYFTVKHTGRYRIDWDWLDRQPAAAETRFVRHLRLEVPLTVKVDGRTGRGLIGRPPDRGDA